MLKITLLDVAGLRLGEAEIDAAFAASPPEIVRMNDDLGERLFVRTPSAAVLAYSEVDPDFIPEVEVIVEPSAPAIEKTRTGARMPLEDGETSAEAAKALADKARGR